eukprot:TRINITY_DN62921_c0_g1_i1.p1 TRINITY_DN62921_c0_g1~~TRINITY_DN62921_c0_g1_i1.p1  ORF type:complete len:692 (-),score=163.10 TRINITY_DN62921_c0_g1_i1:105-2180(-)
MAGEPGERKRAASEDAKDGEEPAAKRGKEDAAEQRSSADQAPCSAPAPSNGTAPPTFGSGADYVEAGDGWWAHKGGQWLYSKSEKTYFHLPTGQLHIATDEDGGTAQVAATRRGRVRWFDSAKGFGFISPDDGSADIFVHRNQIVAEDEDDDAFASLKKGIAVEYIQSETDDGRPCATAVHILSPEEKKQAEKDAPEEEDDDGIESGSEVDLDLEEQLTSGMYQVKGANKDHIEDFAVEKVKVPIDVLGETASCFFFGVYDGHGGSSCAEYAASHLATNVLARLRDRSKGATDEAALKTALLGGFRLTDHNFLQRAKRIGDSAGSTACTMTVFGPDENMRLRLFLANAGDSRAVLGQVGAKAKRLTEDHKPNLPSEKKRIEQANGTVGNVQGIWRCILPPNRRASSGIVGLAVSRSLGDKEFKRPDIVSGDPEITIHELDWYTDEFVILASDGVWDVVSDKVAVRLVRKCLVEGAKEAKAAEELVKHAVERGTKDDCTAVVVRFGWLQLKTEGAAAADASDDEMPDMAEMEAMIDGMEDAEEEERQGQQEVDHDSDDDDEEELPAMNGNKAPVSVGRSKASQADDIFADGAVAAIEEAEAPDAFKVDLAAGASGVGRASADPAGLFQGLMPTQEEVAESVGPARPSVEVSVNISGLLGKKGADADKGEKDDAEPEKAAGAPAVDDDLDMFG